jgi:hypothetical protein
MKHNNQYDNLPSNLDFFYKKSEETLEGILFRLKKHHNAMGVSKSFEEQKNILLNTLELLQQGINMDLVNIIKVVLELEKRGVTESIMEPHKKPEAVIN